MSVDHCPIMSLPDEVLCQIFSFVTDISFKMRLESVCKRFQSISTTQTNSWKGNDRLELVARCTLLRPAGELMVMKLSAECARYTNNNPNILNGRGLSVNKWAKATEQLLQRTVVHKLCVHINSLTTDDLPFVHQVFEVLQNHSGRIKLTYIEFHYTSNQLDYLRNSTTIDAPQRLARDLYMWAFSRSVKTLESVVLSVVAMDFAEEYWVQLCAGVEACHNLKSFSVQIFPLTRDAGRLIQLTDALQGKPLKNIIFDAAHRDELTQFLLPVCQHARGSGITSLKVALPEDLLSYGLVDFANTLHPPTTQSLVELWIGDASINHFIPDLNRLPAIFPNLKELYLVQLEESDLEGALLLNTQFFAVCDETPLVQRRVVIEYVRVADEEELRAGIANLCEEQGIQAVFSDGQQQSELILKKGRGTIEIREIGEVPMRYDSELDYWYPYSSDSD